MNSGNQTRESPGLYGRETIEGSQSMRIAATLAAALMVCAVAGSASASGYESVGTPAGGGSHAAASGGMYGELDGTRADGDGSGPADRPRPAGPKPVRGAKPVSSEASSSGVRAYDSGGTHCSMYANSAGMGSYCSSGDGVYKPLVERFPSLQFDHCRYDDPPAGVEVPQNPNPAEKRWQLRTCLTGIDWFTYDGGDDRRFAMELVLVDKDADTSYHETPLSEFLWNSVETSYPIPMLQVQPRHIPLVNQRAYFTFDWLNGETRKPVNQGPYAGRPGGGPYVEQHNRDLLMRARAGAVTIDPQIEGSKPFTCTVSDLGYDEQAGPQPEDQRSDCHHVFTRSSAAADELSTAKHGDPDAYQLKIDVRWDVEYGNRARGFRPLGSYHMVVYQDLPVMEAQALNIPVPAGEVG